MRTETARALETAKKALATLSAAAWAPGMDRALADLIIADRETWNDFQRASELIGKAEGLFFTAAKREMEMMRAEEA